mmetsp:Transcript_25188/g.60979  ORF Transcript_25188/g.60979 Transcript_25188/m.60979 type:complete len:280 (-) Transcript_25188:862-1701(-)
MMRPSSSSSSAAVDLARRWLAAALSALGKIFTPSSRIPSAWSAAVGLRWNPKPRKVIMSHIAPTPPCGALSISPARAQNWRVTRPIFSWTVLRSTSFRIHAIAGCSSSLSTSFATSSTWHFSVNFSGSQSKNGSLAIVPCRASSPAPVVRQKHNTARRNFTTSRPTIAPLGDPPSGNRERTRSITAGLAAWISASSTRSHWHRCPCHHHPTPHSSLGSRPWYTSSSPAIILTTCPRGCTRRSGTRTDAPRFTSARASTPYWPQVSVVCTCLDSSRSLFA